MPVHGRLSASTIHAPGSTPAHAPPHAPASDAKLAAGSGRFCECGTRPRRRAGRQRHRFHALAWQVRKLSLDIGPQMGRRLGPADAIITIAQIPRSKLGSRPTICVAFIAKLLVGKPSLQKNRLQAGKNLWIKSHAVAPTLPRSTAGGGDKSG